MALVGKLPPGRPLSAELRPPAPPSAPILTLPLSGATVSGSSINFQWASSSGAVGYWLTVIKVSDNSVLINKSVGNILSTTQAGFPNNGTLYKWAVAAGNNIGWTASVWSTFTSGANVPTPPAATPLTSPLSGATVSGSSINFQWEASSGATSYQLTVINVSNNSVLINQNLGNVLSTIQSGFPNNGTLYKWTVAAVNASGSTSSAYWTFTNGSATPTTPVTPMLTSPVSGATISGTSVNFQWAASAGATGYQLSVIKVNDNSVLINKSVGNVLSTIQAGFPNNGTQYKWAVAAVNSAGSTASAYWTFTNGVATTVSPDAPALISPAGGRTVNGVSLDFRWTASAGTTNFRVTIIKVSDNSVMVDRTVGNVLRFTHYGFANDGSQYKWAVAATNGAGWTTSTWQTFISGSK